LRIAAFLQLPGQDLNLDKENQNPPAPRRNFKSHQQIVAADAAGRTAGRTEEGEEGILDADLAALLAAWPILPEPIKAAIRALIHSAGESRNVRE
jgi:hypothetical protein